MMVKTIYTLGAFNDAVDNASNGDTLLVHATDDYYASPKVFTESVEGAAWKLVGKKNISIIGVGNPVLRLRTHGTGLLIQDCENIKIEGITIQGQGILRQLNELSFCLIQFYGTNKFIKVRDCFFLESGNHGIAHLWGPRNTTHSEFTHNFFKNCGNYNRKLLLYDGAAWAVGGCDNLFAFNRVESCLRGAEIENPFYPTSSCNVRIENNTFTGCTWQSIIITPDGTDPLPPAPRLYSLFRNISVCNNVIIGTGTKTEVHSNCGIYVTGAEGIRIQGNHIGSIADGIGILLQTDHSDIISSLISSNLLSDIDRSGIQISVGYNGTPAGNVVRGNLLRNIKGRGIDINAIGTMIDGNNIIGCKWEPLYDFNRNTAKQGERNLWYANAWGSCELEPYCSAA